MLKTVTGIEAFHKWQLHFTGEKTEIQRHEAVCPRSQLVSRL